MISDNNKILVVDDDKQIRSILKWVIKKTKYISEEACSSECALEKINQLDNMYAYIFLDLTMPGELDGRDLFDQIINQNSKSKIVIISGYISREEREYFSSMGVYAILEKPFKPSELLSIIE